MNRIILLLKGVDRKALLLTLGALLLLVNIVRLSLGTYSDQKKELEANQNLLEQYQETAASLPSLKKSVARLKQRSAKLEKYLFTGVSEEEVSSAMQIMIQEQVTRAGLEPESIRPLVTGGRNAPRDFHEIAIKIRLSGSMSQFMDLISQLYRSDKLFQIESFTLKPYKKSEMKIFLDIKGFYTITNG
ncbi:MAG: type II secretion system protein GspM [Pseudomonadota bacterium]